MTAMHATPKPSAETERMAYFMRLFGRLSKKARNEILAKARNEMREQEAEDAQRALSQLTVRS
jgi:hypothetical protein